MPVTTSSPGRPFPLSGFRPPMTSAGQRLDRHTAHERLDELDRELRAMGWRPSSGDREDWRSRAYVTA